MLMILDISIAPMMWNTERIVEIAGAGEKDAAQSRAPQALRECRFREQHAWACGVTS
jgi:hypothetical protein